MVKGRTEVIPSPLKQLLAKIAARPVSHFASASRRESGCASNSGLDIYLVATAAAIGAVVGDNLGYLIGNRYGYPLLQRYGRHIGLTEPRVRLGQYVFQRYGAFIVFFGRFVALLRTLAAFLAGVNHMDRCLFLRANAAGGIIWVITFAYGGYYFGKA